MLTGYNTTICISILFSTRKLYFEMVLRNNYPIILLLIIFKTIKDQFYVKQYEN